METVNVKPKKQKNKTIRKKSLTSAATKSAKPKKLPERETVNESRVSEDNRKSAGQERQITLFELISAFLVILIGIAGYWIAGLLY